MTDRQKEMIKKLGLEESDFEPDAEQTTISDVVEALNSLTEIILGGTE